MSQIADNDDAVPMLTFSITKNADDEVIVTEDWADEFDLLEWTEQHSILLSAIDTLDEVLAYVEDMMIEAEDLEEFTDGEGEDDPDEAA
jgi:hypothetical protein